MDWSGTIDEISPAGGDAQKPGRYTATVADSAGRKIEVTAGSAAEAGKLARAAAAHVQTAVDAAGTTSDRAGDLVFST